MLGGAVDDAAAAAGEALCVGKYDRAGSGFKSRERH